MTIININCCPVSTKKPFRNTTPEPTSTVTPTRSLTPTVTPTTTPTLTATPTITITNTITSTATPTRSLTPTVTPTITTTVTVTTSVTPTAIIPGTYYFRSDASLPSTTWPNGGELTLTYPGGRSFLVFYKDPNFTIPATIPPSGNDTVIIGGNNSIIDMPAFFVNSIWSGNLIIKNNAIIRGGFNIQLRSLSVTDNGINRISIISTNNVIFNNNASNEGGITAPTVIFNNFSSNRAGINGNVILNDCATNSAGITGDLTLNDHSSATGSASGTIIDNSDKICP